MRHAAPMDPCHDGSPRSLSVDLRRPSVTLQPALGGRCISLDLTTSPAPSQASKGPWRRVHENALCASSDDSGHDSDSGTWDDLCLMPPSTVMRDLFLSDGGLGLRSQCSSLASSFVGSLRSHGKLSMCSQNQIPEAFEEEEEDEEEGCEDGYMLRPPARLHTMLTTSPSTAALPSDMVLAPTTTNHHQPAPALPAAAAVGVPPPQPPLIPATTAAAAAAAKPPRPPLFRASSPAVPAPAAPAASQPFQPLLASAAAASVLAAALAGHKQQQAMEALAASVSLRASVAVECRDFGVQADVDAEEEQELQKQARPAAAAASHCSSGHSVECGRSAPGSPTPTVCYEPLGPTSPLAAAGGSCDGSPAARSTADSDCVSCFSVGSVATTVRRGSRATADAATGTPTKSSAATASARRLAAESVEDLVLFDDECLQLQPHLYQGSASTTSSRVSSLNGAPCTCHGPCTHHHSHHSHHLSHLHPHDHPLLALGSRAASSGGGGSAASLRLHTPAGGVTSGTAGLAHAAGLASGLASKAEAKVKLGSFHNLQALAQAKAPHAGSRYCRSSRGSCSDLPALIRATYSPHCCSPATSRANSCDGSSSSVDATSAWVARRRQGWPWGPQEEGEGGTSADDEVAGGAPAAQTPLDVPLASAAAAAAAAGGSGGGLGLGLGLSLGPAAVVGPAVASASSSAAAAAAVAPAAAASQQHPEELQAADAPVVGAAGSGSNSAEPAEAEPGCCSSGSSGSGVAEACAGADAESAEACAEEPRVEEPRAEEPVAELCAEPSGAGSEGGAEGGAADDEAARGSVEELVALWERRSLSSSTSSSGLSLSLMRMSLASASSAAAATGAGASRAGSGALFAYGGGSLGSSFTFQRPRPRLPSSPGVGLPVGPGAAAPAARHTAPAAGPPEPTPDAASAAAPPPPQRAPRAEVSEGGWGSSVCTPIPSQSPSSGGYSGCSAALHEEAADAANAAASAATATVSAGGAPQEGGLLAEDGQLLEELEGAGQAGSQLLPAPACPLPPAGGAAAGTEPSLSGAEAEAAGAAAAEAAAVTAEVEAVTEAEAEAPAAADAADAAATAAAAAAVSGPTTEEVPAPTERLLVLASPGVECQGKEAARSFRATWESEILPDLESYSVTCESQAVPDLETHRITCDLKVAPDLDSHSVTCSEEEVQQKQQQQAPGCRATASKGRAVIASFCIACAEEVESDEEEEEEQAEEQRGKSSEHEQASMDEGLQASGEGASSQPAEAGSGQGFRAGGCSEIEAWADDEEQVEVCRRAPREGRGRIADAMPFVAAAVLSLASWVAK